MRPSTIMMMLGFTAFSLLAVWYAFGVMVAGASTSGLVSDYHGVRPSDGSTFTISENNGRIWVTSDSDNNVSQVIGLDSMDGSSIDIIHN